MGKSDGAPRGTEVRSRLENVKGIVPGIEGSMNVG